MTAEADKQPQDDVLRDILVPSFLVRNQEGVFVNLPKLQSAEEFEQFVTRLFGAGLVFRGLEYLAFQKLLYDHDWLLSSQSKSMELKLADDIVRFPPQRRELYHAVKLTDEGKAAEYLFEPINIEVSYQEAITGEPDASGVIPILEYRTRTRLQPDQLDFDEFIADMWLKDVRFGIDVETVRNCIASRAAQRSIIARQQDPTEGRDAEIKEACSHLHRDNSPKTLASGKIDLRTFQNRFPQMSKGEPMLKKIPRQLGKQGRKIDGGLIEPRLPKDVDLTVLAGMGTRIEQGNDGEYIVAAMEGFLNLDSATSQVSITEKIENKAGISVKTTGNLALSVDEFIEHGEVQEGRLVNGRHMTFMSNVFGSISAHDGNIQIKKNLSGGKAQAINGNIEISGSMSRADARTLQGELVVNSAENSLLMGKLVRIKHAVNCTIIADELHAEQVEGCLVGARNISIASAAERRDRESLIDIIIPDYSPLDQRLADLDKSDAELQQKLATATEASRCLCAEPDFAKFLALQASIKQGAVKLSEEQRAGLGKLVQQHAAALKQLADLQADTATLQQSLQSNASERQEIKDQRVAMGAGITCSISQVNGQTIGLTMKSANGIGIFADLDKMSIDALLQKIDSSKSRIFSGNSGSLDWQFDPHARS